MSSTAMAPRARRREWRALFHRASLAPGMYTDRLDEMNGIAGFVELSLVQASLQRANRHAVQRSPGPLPPLLRAPLGAQADAIRGAARRSRSRRSAAHDAQVEAAR